MNKSNKLFFLSILLFISIIFSYVFFEDTLGGARQDYLFHEKFIVLFADDFKNTFSNYGDADLFARNSPIFYILFSFLYKIGIDLESLRYLNIVSIPLLTLLAVPLSVVNPRQGKFAKLVPAISLYLGYFILLNAAKFAVEDGKIPPSIGLWWIHLSALFIGGFLIIKGRPLGAWLKAVVTKRELSA